MTDTEDFNAARDRIRAEEMAKYRAIMDALETMDAKRDDRRDHNRHQEQVI